MEFLRRQALTSILLLFYVHLISGASSGSASWCTKEDSYDPYGVALEYLGVPTIREPQLDQLIQDVFGRLGCQQMTFTDNVTCENCLESSNVYKVLQLTSGSDLTEPMFRNASTIVVSYLYNLHDACVATKSLDWNQVTYSHFTRIILSLPDDAAANSSAAAPPSYLSEHQLENMLRGISEEYLPGDNYTTLSSCGMTTEAAVRDVCSFGNIKSFSSLDVETLTVPATPDEGIHEDELGRMNAIILSKLLSGECISRVEEHLAVAEDFVRAIYDAYTEPGGCLISIHGLEEMAAALSIGGSSTDHEHGGHVIPPEHSSSSSSRKRRDAAANLEEESHDHSVDVKTTCLTVEEILGSFGFADPEAAVLSKRDFTRICPSLVQQAVQGCPNAAPEETTKPSEAETYGYGTASVLVISLCAMLGLVVAPWRRTRVYKYVLTTMLGLGVGALTGDALLHLIPQSLGLHDHSSEANHSSSGVEPHVWKMLCTCLSIWGYYLLQLGLYTFVESRDRHKVDISTISVSSSSNGIKNSAADLDEETGHASSSSNRNKKMDGSPEVDTDPHPSSKFDDFPVKSTSVDHLEKDLSDVVSLDVHAHVSVAWMVTIGDGLHNFADGLAIGAAYCVNWQTGLSTSIAVFTHELPHEFGDVALLLSTGWSTKKVLIFQLIAQSTAFVGLYVGISISENAAGAQQWIFAVAAGMFLYIALADVIPELLEFYKRYSRLHVAVLSNVGVFIGFLALLLIAIFEDDIVIS